MKVSRWSLRCLNIACSGVILAACAYGQPPIVPQPVPQRECKGPCEEKGVCGERVEEENCTAGRRGPQGQCWACTERGLPDKRCIERKGSQQCWEWATSPCGNVTSGRCEYRWIVVAPGRAVRGPLTCMENSGLFPIPPDVTFCGFRYDCRS